MANIIAKLAISIFLTAAAFAGQSISINTQSAGNPNVIVSNTANWSFEFYAHGWNNSTAAGYIWVGNGIGYHGHLLNIGGANLVLSLIPTAGGSLLCQAPLGANANLPTVAVYVRVQHDHTGAIGAPNTDHCEVWDTNGNLFFSDSGAASSSANAATLTAGYTSDANAGYMAFMRVCNGVVPLNSQMPTTAGSGGGTGCTITRTPVVEWKFDGNLNDSSGNGYTATMSSGSPAYITTPYQNVIAVLKTTNAPFWANTVSLRGGNAGALNGTTSFSQSDAGSGVSCFWQVLSGPSSPTWSSHAGCTVTLTGLVFGDYLTQLTVTDGSGGNASTTGDIGVVATDTNGVVVQGDPNADIIYGPMIAYGQNPWGYEDYWHNYGSQLRTYGSPTSYWPWLTRGQGTVAYKLGSNGCGLGSATGTTLQTAITASSTSIVVNDAGQLDLSELPTRVLLCNGAETNVEEVRIIATSGNSGQQTLTVAYDGRASSAIANNAGGYYGEPTAQSYNAGATVGQYKVKGTGTKFLTDPNRPMCPAGAGPAGSVDYQAGTLDATAGSSTITVQSGSGAIWAITMVQNGDHVRIQGTHAGGTPFVFAASLVTFTDSNHIIMSRPYPSDADSGTGLTYQFLLPNYLLSTEYIRTDGITTGRFLSHTTGCESEDGVYGMVAVDMGANNGSSQTSQKYSWKTGLGVQSAFGPNFYGEGLAHRALYLRSGLASALTNANTMDEYWVQDPEVDGGTHGGIPLLQGGGVVGAFVDVVLNKQTALTWPMVRTLASTASGASAYSCNSVDTRDSGYYYSWLTLAYMFDPNSAFHATWKAAIGTGNPSVYYRDTSVVNPITGASGCKGADNSWANGFLINGNGPRISVVNNSTTVTAVLGDVFDPVKSCYDHAHGSATVTKGSTAITGSGFLNLTGGGITPQIVVTGTKSGQPFAQWFPFQYNSSTSGTLAGVWTGDSGPVTYILKVSAPGAAPDFDAIGIYDDQNSTTAPYVADNWACSYVDTTHVTLNRPWPHPSNSSNLLHWFSAYGNSSLSLAGYGQQPYMLGIRLRFMDWLATGAPGAADFTTQYAPLKAAAATWMHDTAFESDSLAFSYGRVYQACEPTIGDGGLGYNYRNGGACQNGLEPTDILPNARELTAEAGSALKAYWDANGGNGAALTFGDHAYGALYGNPAYTTGGVFSDGIYAGATSNLTASYVGSFKYFGFFFGMGMSHQWPAVRLGGVLPAKNRALIVSFDLASIPNATQVSVMTTAPSGAVTTTTCSSSPCTVNGDARQGTHFIRLTYKSAGSAILATGDPLIVVVQ